MFFKRRKKIQEAETVAVAVEPEQNDPIDIITRGKGKSWRGTESRKFKIELKRANEFPVADASLSSPDGMVYVGDSKKVEGSKKIIEGTVMDHGECDAVTMGKLAMNSYTVPEALAAWYANQSFIGYQMCAIIAQHWLVEKACSQSCKDAVRNGWELKADLGHNLTPEQKAQIEDCDVRFGVKNALYELGRFTNIFGIRVLIFKVKSSDPEYYSKPFNIDGIAPGSYLGMSQVDPYWMTPMLSNESMSDPSAIHFYEPEFWIINGKRYHRSHLVITRGPQPADILKPTYIFGGVPLVQRIYERVYAAERTANEAPLLAMNKRTTALHVDLDKVAANEESFVERLMKWVFYRDNHSVKVLGKEESMEQFDTSLADLDSVIMNQHQLVAAISETPATKILGTSPKGFDSSGEFETVSYHEKLESIQEEWYDPALDRHYEIMLKSMEIPFGVSVIWNTVDAMTAAARAEINNKKVNDVVNLITVGVISPDEGRDKLATDKDSGWNNLNQDDDADTEMGMSPENIAELEKAGAQTAKGNAAEAQAGIPANAAPVEPAPSIDAEQAANPSDEKGEALLTALLSKLERIETFITPEGRDSAPTPMGVRQGVTPGVIGVHGTVAGVGQVIPALDPAKLPKIKVSGMMCVIENPRNSIRSGSSVDGAWSIKIPHHYGFIRGTMGADGDEVDCFIGPNLKSQRVFVINQNDVNSGDFDEHKCMIGFNNAAEAKQAYEQSYSQGFNGFGNMVEMAMPAFKSWVLSSSNENPLDQEAIGAETQNAPQEPNNDVQSI